VEESPPLFVSSGNGYFLFLPLFLGTIGVVVSSIFLLSISVSLSCSCSSPPSSSPSPPPPGSSGSGDFEG